MKREYLVKIAKAAIIDEMCKLGFNEKYLQDNGERALENMAENIADATIESYNPSGMVGIIPSMTQLPNLQILSEEQPDVFDPEYNSDEQDDGNFERFAALVSTFNTTNNNTDMTDQETDYPNENEGNMDWSGTLKPEAVTQGARSMGMERA